MNNRRGSVYILILSASMLVAIIGISALTAARIQHRAAAGTDDLAAARVYARSALEIAVHNISQDPNWRTTYGNTNWPKNQPIGNGVYTIEALDPEDGDITTGALDPVELTGVGTMGLATQKIRVRLEADPAPLAVLNTALHAESQVEVVKETVNGALIEVSNSGSSGYFYALRAKPAPLMMYWTERTAAAGAVATIKRARLDGTGVENLVTTGLTDPRGIAVDADGGKMYWTDRASIRIQRANTDGTVVETLVTGLTDPRGPALDVAAGKMYWGGNGSPFQIRRANFDGSVAEGVVAGAWLPRGIALDPAGKIYWGNKDATIRRSNIDGTALELLVTGVNFSFGIALDPAAGKMYWIENTRIQRANLDGSAVEELVTGLAFGFGLAVDLAGGKMYWTDFTLNKIQRANLDGTVIEDLVTTGISEPMAITLGIGSAADIYAEASWHPWAIVPVDANQVLEGRIENADVDFFLVGHTLAGAKQSFTYIEPSVDVTPATAGAWTSVDVSAMVPAGATGVIVHVIGASGGDRIWGLRKRGSTDDRTEKFYPTDHVWAMIGVDSGRVFQAFIQNTDMTLRLAGYTTAGVTFFTNAWKKSLSVVNTWTDIDISAHTGADPAIGAIIEIDGNWQKPYGVRMKGSTDNRIWDTRHSWAVIGVDSAEVFQAYITALNVDFYLVGYITKGAVFHTNAHDISVTIPGAPYVDIDISTLTGATATLTAVGAPVSCDIQIVNDGVIYGDAEAVMVITNNGTITGTQTVAPFVPSKAMPASTVVDMYIALATTIPNPGSIDGKVLSPGNNPWGATDPDGVYYIDTLGGDLTIRASRIHGTLVVKCGSGTVRLETAALLHPYRTDYPTLIVDGNLEVLLDSGDMTLSEAQWGVNFNPSGTRFKAISNADMTDEYPNEIQGLVHVTRNLLMSRSSRVWGAIICESTATCQQNTAVIHDPDLYANPPLGYTESVAAPPMTIVSGTWQQVVD